MKEFFSLFKKKQMCGFINVIIPRNKTNITKKYSKNKFKPYIFETFNSTVILELASINSDFGNYWYFKILYTYFYY